MAQVLVTESYISDIASAIRSKNGQSASYTPSQMAAAIGSIQSAGELNFISQTFSANGSYLPATYSADAFTDIVVDVANTYTAEDEGKVVVSGELSIQGALSVSNNSIYDTTLFSQVTVNVESAPIVLVSKTISENGTYHPADDSADAYSQVVVSVAGGGGVNEEVIEGYIQLWSNSTISNIRPYGLYSAKNLSAVSLANCKSIDQNAFAYCTNLSYIDLPECTFIGSSAFLYDINLEYISASKLKKISYCAFGSCSKLTIFNAPNLSFVSDYVFSDCRELSSISLPNCMSIMGGAFFHCYSLSCISLPLCNRIDGQYAFRYCSSLVSVILLSESVCILYRQTAFANTPISNSSYLGYYGSIFVPASLVDSYKTASNWSYYSDRITAYEEE